jgi:hypothetical protein
MENYENVMRESLLVDVSEGVVIFMIQWLTRHIPKFCLHFCDYPSGSGTVTKSLIESLYAEEMY